MTRERVLAAINASRNEITTAQLAEQLGAPRYAIGSALSKLAAYGQINGRRGAPANGFLWSRKEGDGG